MMLMLMLMLGGGKDAIMGDKGEKRGFLWLLCFSWQYCTWRPHCVTSWMLRSCNPSTHSLLVLAHPLFLCFVNPPELECTQYWVTSHHPSSVKAKKAINSVSCSSSILCISQAAFLGIENCYLRQLIKLLQRDSYKSFMQVASTTGSRPKELVKGQPIAF